uniref:Secreted protein n=1 Tax=Pseudo-nitzschia australis TaxID=44445 RepID=A0A7S4AF29_9STRA
MVCLNACTSLLVTWLVMGTSFDTGTTSFTVLLYRSSSDILSTDDSSSNSVSSSSLGLLLIVPSTGTTCSTSTTEATALVGLGFGFGFGLRSTPVRFSVRFGS